MLAFDFCAHSMLTGTASGLKWAARRTWAAPASSRLASRPLRFSHGGGNTQRLGAPTADVSGASFLRPSSQNRALGRIFGSQLIKSRYTGNLSF